MHTRLRPSPEAPELPPGVPGMRVGQLERRPAGRRDRGEAYARAARSLRRRARAAAARRPAMPMRGRRERGDQQLLGRPAEDAADEALARAGEQNRDSPARAVRRSGRGSRDRCRLFAELEPGIDRRSRRAATPAASARSVRSRKKCDDLAHHVGIGVAGRIAHVQLALEVHHDQRRVVRATTPARSGSDSPLQSLITCAPAASAASATLGFEGVDRDRDVDAGRANRLDRRHDPRALFVGRDARVPVPRTIGRRRRRARRPPRRSRARARRRRRGRPPGRRTSPGVTLTIPITRASSRRSSVRSRNRRRDQSGRSGSRMRGRYRCASADRRCARSWRRRSRRDTRRRDVRGSGASS